MITNLFLAQAIENGDHADRYTAGETKVALSVVGDTLPDSSQPLTIRLGL